VLGRRDDVAGVGDLAVRNAASAAGGEARRKDDKEAARRSAPSAAKRRAILMIGVTIVRSREIIKPSARQAGSPAHDGARAARGAKN
jgi:hypothetical protein